MSSQNSATTPRSCVTNSIDKPNSRDQITQQIEDLLLRRDIERGRRLVGDDQRRRAGERRRDQQPLPLAARELVRIAFERRLRVGQLHPAQQRRRCGRGARAYCRHPACQRMISRSCAPILNTGFSAKYGSCGTKPMRRPRMRRLSSASPRASRFSPAKPISPDLDPHAGRQDAEDRPDHGRLAAAGLADDAEDVARLAARNRYGRGPARYPRRCGSTA